MRSVDLDPRWTPACRVIIVTYTSLTPCDLTNRRTMDHSIDQPLEHHVHIALYSSKVYFEVKCTATACESRVGRASSVDWLRAASWQSQANSVRIQGGRVLQKHCGPERVK